MSQPLALSDSEFVFSLPVTGAVDHSTLQQLAIKPPSLSTYDTVVLTVVPEGKADLTYAVRITRPDGEVYHESDGMTGWRRAVEEPGIVLLPGADDLARDALAGLPQPFTASEARQRLGTSRRVVLPLLDHLDRTGRTRRLPDDRREVVAR